MAGEGRGGASWARGVLRRLERAEQAVNVGQVGPAFDAYVVAYHALAARWPESITDEESLDDWFDRESAASEESPSLSEALSNLLWMRVRLDEDEGERRRRLCRIAEDLIPRLAPEDYLVREAHLTQTVSQVIDATPESQDLAVALCERYPEDPWLRLELSRAYGHLRPTERRDLDLARHYAEEALALGGEETDLFVYEDLASLYEEAQQSGDITLLNQDFWTPERVGRALRTYGADPPIAVIEAALRFEDAMGDQILGILRSPAVRAQCDDLDDSDEERHGALWWSAVHALRLVAALRSQSVASDVSRWLSCDLPEIREVLPLVAARLGSAIVEPYVAVLGDREEPLRARSNAIIGLTAAALLDEALRATVVRHLRFWAFNDSAPRGLRTEAAYRLVMLADLPSREAIEEGLGTGEIDRFLFDEDDIALFFGDDPAEPEPDPAHELGLHEAPLAPYYEPRQDEAPVGADEAEVEDLADLISDVTAAELSPLQERRMGGSGPAAPFARGRRRLALHAAEELGLKGWLDSLYLFLGPGPNAAADCQRLSLEWPFVDFVTLDIVDRAGESLARRFLTEPPLMSADERGAIERLAASRVRVLEVTASPAPGEGGALCRDVFTSQRLRVTLPHRLEPVCWDLLLGRVVEGDGSADVLLYAHHLPRRDLPAMVEEIGAAARQIETMLPPAAPAQTALRLAAATYLAQTVRAEGTSDPPTVRDRDGAPIVFSEAVYSIEDWAHTIGALAGIEGLHRIEDEPPSQEPEERRADFRWLGPEEEELLPGARRLLGEVLLRGDRLTLRCHTRERLTEGRELIEAVSEGALRHRANTFADPGALAFRGGSQTAGPSAEDEDSEVLREEAQRLVHTLIERHYERWLDQPLRALRGQTPREAAHRPELRPALEELVRVIENIEAHRARAEGIDFDVSRLRLELELPGD